MTWMWVIENIVLCGAMATFVYFGAEFVIGYYVERPVNLIRKASRMLSFCFVVFYMLIWVAPVFRNNIIQSVAGILMIATCVTGVGVALWILMRRSQS